MNLSSSNLNNLEHDLAGQSYLDRLEAYLATPLEEDPAQLAAIAAQVAVLPEIASEQSPYRFSPYQRATSLHSASSSNSSCCSFLSQNTRKTRRGRKRYTEVRYEVFVPNTSRDTAYFCTFCGTQSKDVYQWKHHEATVHMPQSLWVCCLSPCPESKHADDRTFMRRDQFIQHMPAVHSDTTDDAKQAALTQAHTKAPMISSDHPALKCGFCGKVSTDWESRVNHVSDHFKHGAKLTSWWLKRLDRGPSMAEDANAVLLGKYHLELWRNLRLESVCETQFTQTMRGTSLIPTTISELVRSFIGERKAEVARLRCECVNAGLLTNIPGETDEPESLCTSVR